MKIFRLTDLNINKNVIEPLVSTYYEIYNLTFKCLRAIFMIFLLERPP